MCIRDRYIDQISAQRLTDEAIKLTGLDNPNSTAQLVKWLQDNGTETDNLRKETVSELLDGINPEKVQRMLEIRQQLGKTSIKKYVAMNTACGEGDRVRGLTPVSYTHLDVYKRQV